MITDAMHTPTTIAPKAFFPVDAKEGCDKSSGPGSGSRKRDSYEEYQPPEFISADPITFAHRFFLQLFYKRTEKARLAQPCKNRTDQKQDKRNWDQVPHQTDRDCTPGRDI